MITLPTDSHTSPPPSVTNGSNHDLDPNIADLKWTTTNEGTGHSSELPVSVTKLTFGLRVGFIGSHLTVDKLFPVNPRAITSPPKMSLLFEAKSTPRLFIKPGLILVAHAHG